MSAKSFRAAALLSVAWALGLSARAGAAEVNLASLDEGGANSVHLRTGAEYGFVAGVGYDRVVTFAHRRLLLTSDLTFPWAKADRADYRLRVGATLPVAFTAHWRAAVGLAPTVRHTVNDLATMTSLGADAAATAGFYARRWFAAGELGFDWNGATHVDNSPLYKQTVFAAARDGWYRDDGGNVRAGVQAGASLARYDVVLRVGMVRDQTGQAPMLPFYGTLTLAGRW